MGVAVRNGDGGLEGGWRSGMGMAVWNGVAAWLQQGCISWKLVYMKHETVLYVMSATCQIFYSNQL